MPRRVQTAGRSATRILPESSPRGPILGLVSARTHMAVHGKVIVPVEYEQIRLIDKDFLILAKTGEIHYLYLPDNLILKLKAIDE